MGEIVLVRHGQANSDATDEASYDKLSDLGHQQARWLGEWLRAQGETFDRVLAGTLVRHNETAIGMGYTPEQDARLNEMDYFNLGRALEEVHAIPFPDLDGFETHAPKVLEAWHAAEIQGDESFASFEDRITSVVQEAAEPGVRVLAITSGGVIGMIVRHLLDLSPRNVARVFIPIYNSSIHRIHVRPNGMLLSTYNATPHLDAQDRATAKTNY